MKNSTLSKISTQKSGFPRSKFNLSHDVNTTCSWGDCQPLMCRAMLPDSKASVSVESLVRLAPMVAPTFGDAQFKTYHMFVAMSDLTRNFDALMSQTRVNRGGTTSSFVPSVLPCCTLGDLSIMTLVGSYCTVYENRDGGYLDAIHPWKTYNDGTGMGTLFANLATDLSAVTGDTWTADNIRNSGSWPTNNVWNAASGCMKFNASVLVPDSDVATCSVRAGNGVGESPAYWIPVIPNSSQGHNAAFGFSSPDYVSMETADVLIMREINGHGYAFAFRLSDFGKRLRKAMIGCGYQVYFDTPHADASQYVSLMPLLALHKAWFELFAPQLFDNYEDTAANKLLQTYDNVNTSKYGFGPGADFGRFVAFIKELGSLWYTEKPQFVNAHTANVTSNATSVSLDSFIDVSGSAGTIGPASSNVLAGNVVVPEGASGQDYHARIQQVIHGQLDSELLKRLYKWTNRNSLVGQRVRDLLIQQGLADYVDSCEPRFIGYDSTHINISDIRSSADTFNSATDDGKILGEFGGSGLQYVDPKHYSFEAKEYGWYIVLAAVVPEAGYCQALDKNVMSIDKMSFYQPEFDGLGMEANPKLMVCADAPISRPKLTTSNSLSATFGFAPRSSALKVSSNKMNGDFNLRSLRDTYEPYTLDRIFEIGEFTSSSTDSGNTRSIIIADKFSPSQFPIAGNVWKYVTRYPFLSNFNRIFANMGDPSVFRKSVGPIDFTYEVGHSAPDNFLVHNIVHMDYYAKMLPIEDSYEVLDDGNDGKPNSSVEKA